MSRLPFTTKHTIMFTEHHGGKATDLKQGQPHSFGYSRHLDFRKNPTGLSILPSTVKASGAVVTGLVVNQIMLPSGKMLALDSSGGVYSITTSGVWSKLSGTLPTPVGPGMHYNAVQDIVYIPGADTMHTITAADNVFGGTTTVNSNQMTQNLDQSGGSHASSYTTLSTLDDVSAVNKLSVTPSVEPMYSIKVWIVTKGTGNLIATLHDAQNNTIATATLLNASATAGQLNEIVFTTPARNTVKPNASTYHVHFTHTTATAYTIGTTTASDCSTAQYETYANRFVRTVSGWKPSIPFLQYMLIGNGRYIAAWEIISQPSAGVAATQPLNTEFYRHRVVLEPNHEVTSFALWGEMVAAAAGRFSSTTGQDFQEGKIYLWDGVSAGWNTSFDVPEGVPYALTAYQGTLFYLAGNSLMAWAGGRPVKILQLPNTDFEFSGINSYTINNPYTIAVRNGILQIGFCSATNSTTIEVAVYSYGARDKNYNQSLGYSYSISTGSRLNSGNTVQIGMVRSFGSKMYVSWRDGSTYGVDVVDATNPPFSTATYQTLRIDLGRPDREKEVVFMRLEFETLPTGVTVTPKYKINREANWQTDANFVLVPGGDNFIIFPINKRFKEIEIGFDMTATTVTPNLISIGMLVDTLLLEAE